MLFRSSGIGTQWLSTYAGISTTANVGIGTTLPNDSLQIGVAVTIGSSGNATFAGVVTATSFQSLSAGTPTIDSPNNVNINAVTVAISTDVTVGRELRVAGITTINAGGMRVAGVVTATSLSGALFVAGSVAPATSTSAGTAGEIRYDANYIYICTATNTWKRVGIATW